MSTNIQGVPSDVCKVMSGAICKKYKHFDMYTHANCKYWIVVDPSCNKPPVVIHGTQQTATEYIDLLLELDHIRVLNKISMKKRQRELPFYDQEVHS